MIFLTVGHDTPFDRLVRCVDNWCQDTERSNVFGQIGEITPGSFQPAHFQWVSFLDPSQFQQKFEQANLIIAHAGTGTIITALMKNKPIIIMPRRSDLEETRNDHQIATAGRFNRRPEIEIAMDDAELIKALDNFYGRKDRAKSVRISPYAETQLTNALRNFILR